MSGDGREGLKRRKLTPSSVDPNVDQVALRNEVEENTIARLHIPEFSDYQTLGTLSGSADPTLRSRDADRFDIGQLAIPTLFRPMSEDDFDREILLEQYRGVVMKTFLLYYIAGKEGGVGAGLEVSFARQMAILESAMETDRARSVYRVHVNGKSQLLLHLHSKLVCYNQLYYSVTAVDQILFLNALAL